MSRQAGMTLAIEQPIAIRVSRGSAEAVCSAQRVPVPTCTADSNLMGALPLPRFRRSRRLAAGLEPATPKLLRLWRETRSLSHSSVSHPFRKQKVV